MKIIFDGWHEGFSKVDLNRFLRKNFSFSISEAKDFVDEILNYRKVELNSEITDRPDLEKELEAIKVKFQIID